MSKTQSSVECGTCGSHTKKRKVICTMGPDWCVAGSHDDSGHIQVCVINQNHDVYPTVSIFDLRSSRDRILTARKLGEGAEQRAVKKFATLVNEAAPEVVKHFLAELPEGKRTKTFFSGPILGC